MNALRTLRHDPQIAILYVLIYWGRTLCWTCLVGINVLWLIGVPPVYRVLCASVGILAAGFNAGLTVGLMGPPPGRRR